jgi:hypothetical protein
MGDIRKLPYSKRIKDDDIAILLPSPFAMDYANGIVIASSSLYP